MKDISELKMLENPRTWKQFVGFMLFASAASMAAGFYFEAPWLFCLLLGAFWLLPLTNMQTVKRDIRLALESYEGNRSMGGTATWTVDSSGDSDSYGAEVSLGSAGTWHMDFSGATRPFAKDKKNAPAVVTVWLHPKSGEPRLLKSEEGFFYPKTIKSTPL